MQYENSIITLKGIGPQKQKGFASLGIEKIIDLMMYFPFRYDDFSEAIPVYKWQEGQTVVFVGKILNLQNNRTQRGKTIVKALLEGSQGTVVATWFGRWQLHKVLKPGDELFCVGKFQSAYQKELIVSEHVLLKKQEDALKHMRINPVYSATSAISSKVITQYTEIAIELLNEEYCQIDTKLLDKHQLLPWTQAIKSIHFPRSIADLERAQHTLKIWEFMLLILWAMTENHYAILGTAHQTAETLTGAYIERLPYQLTSDQQKVLNEIWKDMACDQQMHRLLQGDVGSGKTEVATLMLLKAIGCGHQGVLMAPTEILAKQHYCKIKQKLNSLGINVGLLTASVSKKEKEIILSYLANGDISLLVGTHALLEPQVIFKDLTAVVIDEQHRFGVRQRQLLESKGKNPDLLVMTATPIPRSLALTIYGDLDLSVIEELPPGRQAIETYWVRENKRQDMYLFLEKALAEGRQAYVVCPLVAESEKIDLANATAIAQNLSEHIFKNRYVALLHGKMTVQEKDDIMNEFAQGKIDILVSTTVVEVGIDVANANFMIVENAERFGLAQLHQLRGRVGRGKYTSYCILMSETTSEEGQKRLKTMVKNSSGFAISEADLAMRGPGELLGLKQHGVELFNIADPVADAHLVPAAKEIADYVYNSMLHDDDIEGLLMHLKRKLSP